MKWRSCIYGQVNWLKVYMCYQEKCGTNVQENKSHESKSLHLVTAGQETAVPSGQEPVAVYIGRRPLPAQKRHAPPSKKNKCLQ